MARQPSPREVAGYFRSLGRFVRQRKEREAHDLSVAAELSRMPLCLPPGLELEWLGVAGYRLTYEGQSLLIDPYLTRASLGDVIGGRQIVADEQLHARLIDPHASQVVGVLAGHTHFDHAIDVPALAKRYGARAYGSRSLVQLMRAYGLAERATEVEPGKSFELGPFTVSFHRSLHSKLILGLAVPSDGELTCEHVDGLSPSAYKCGDVFGIKIEVAGVSFYHQGSANLIEDDVPRGGVDYFLAGVAGRMFTTGYWARILRLLQPGTVIASHFDDFFRPAEAEAAMSLNVHLARVPDEIAAVSRGIRVAALRAFEPVSG